MGALMSRLAVLVTSSVLIVSQAVAEDLFPVTCSERPSDLRDGGATLSCEVTNNAFEAVARLGVVIAIEEEGRTVPWGAFSGEVNVPGGIEPNETRTLDLPSPPWPDETMGGEVFVHIEPLIAVDIDGYVIGPDGVGLSPALRAAQAEAAAAARATAAVAALSEAARDYPNQVMGQLARTPRDRVSTSGTAVIGFTVTDAGGLGALGVAQSSGVAEVDQAGLALVQRAAPFDPPPEGAQRSFSFQFTGR